MVRIILTSRFAMWMAWGPDLTFFCNDAYLPTTGIKQNWVLGARSDKVWSEIWPDIGPRIEHVLKTGEATWDEALLLYLERSGFPEETYHTFSYSPLRDDGGATAGMLCVVTEVTERMIGERQLATLRDLGTRLAAAATRDEVMRGLEACLTSEPRDLPFAAAYLLQSDGHAIRAALHGVGPAVPVLPACIDVENPNAPWPLASCLTNGGQLLVKIPPASLGTLSQNPWPSAPKEALIVPIKSEEGTTPAGWLIAGLNPHRIIDDSYRGFVDLITGQVAAAIARSDAYERERARAEALAEIDRAKTLFFSNVSHEFRTPLTLMLTPMEELLGKGQGKVAPENRALIEVAHRSGLRLLKLVNTLLDFSRIEAGRVQAVYEPVDLAAWTAELASHFRSVTQIAGLELIVDCPPLPEAVFIDRDMWEKIVLNLVSNAFKFTFEGQIAVTLRRSEDGKHATLSVGDTGTGIPREELPRLFERFHRVEGARGRSFEGSGIGLALVQELVKLHGGMISVESEIDRGSMFTVAIPFGSLHLPQDRTGGHRNKVSTALRPQAFVEEALRWLPKDAGVEGAVLDAAVPPALFPLSPGEPGRPRILLADDNADMRDYVRHLLEGFYEVEALADGEIAFASAQRNPPALILSDVMMPRLDGFGLVRAVRGDKRLQDIPIILLSARAGDEAKIEGLEAGADDYLVKPFSARELVARIQTNLQLSKIRKTAEEELRKRTLELEAVLETVPAAVWFTRDPKAAHVIGNRYASALLRLEEGAQASLTAGEHERPGFAFFCNGTAIAPMDLPLQRAARGEKVAESEIEVQFPGGNAITLLIRAATLRGQDGDIQGAVAAAMDITDRKRAEELHKLLINELNHRVKNTLAIVQSIANQTITSSEDSETLRKNFDGRLIALAKAHDVLTRESWKGASLREIVEGAVGIYRSADRDPFRIAGPEIFVSARQALAFALALHELGTNAMKYGALSAAKGSVEISWTVRKANSVAHLNFRWAEAAGPPVKPPSRRGFGTRLLERGLKHDLRGSVSMEFRPTGVIFTIQAPAGGSDGRDGHLRQKRSAAYTG